MLNKKDKNMEFYRGFRLNRNILLFGFIAIILVVIGCDVKQGEQVDYSGNVKKVTLSHTGNPDSGLIQIAIENGYFREQGLDVDLVKHNSGKASLEAVINKEVDVGVSAETPMIFAVLREDDFLILAKISTAENTEAIVGRKDVGITSLMDLRGKRVATLRGTSSEYFLESLLEVNGLTSNDLMIIDINPIEIREAIIKGDVDAVAIWQPHIFQIQQTLGDDVVSFYGDKLIHSYKFYLVGNTEFVLENPTVTIRLMDALAQAEKYLNENPEDGAIIISNRSNNNLDFVKEVYLKPVSLQLLLDQSMLLVLEDQTRWAIVNNLTTSTKIPNYLNYIYMDALDAVKPEAISIIR